MDTINTKEVISMFCTFVIIHGSVELHRISIVDRNGDAIINTLVKKTDDVDYKEHLDYIENESYLLFNNVRPFLIGLFYNKIILVQDPDSIFRDLGIPNENMLDVTNLLVVDANGNEMSASIQLVYKEIFNSLIHDNDTLKNAKLFMHFFNMCIAQPNL